MAIRHPEKHHFQVSPNYQADATSASFGPTRAFLKKKQKQKTTEISKSDSENLFFFLMCIQPAEQRTVSFAQRLLLNFEKTPYSLQQSAVKA